MQCHSQNVLGPWTRHFEFSELMIIVHWPAAIARIYDKENPICGDWVRGGGRVQRERPPAIRPSKTRLSPPKTSSGGGRRVRGEGVLRKASSWRCDAAACPGPSPHSPATAAAVAAPPAARPSPWRCSPAPVCLARLFAPRPGKHLHNNGYDGCTGCMHAVCLCLCRMRYRHAVKRYN